MDLPLIAAESDFALWAIMLLMTGLTLSLEKTPWGGKLSGPIIMIVIAAVLSNLQIIPKSAAVYGSIWSYGVPVAVVLLLFNADLKKIFTESGPTLLAFIIGAIGTSLGVLAGVYLLPLGDKTPELAAVFSATYIGGSLNFAAVSEAIGFDDSSLLTASLAADNVVGTAFLALLIAMPGINIIARFFGYDSKNDKYRVDGNTSSDIANTQYVSIQGSSIALGVGFVIVAISDFTAQLLGHPELRILVATALTVALSTAAPSKMQKITAAFPIGMAILYMFFGLIGAGVDIVAMINSGLTIATFAAIILLVHLIVLLPVCRLLKLDLPEVLIGSNACVVGPPSAAAMAGAKGWKTLITPAILCGTLGYTLANFIGLLFYNYLA